MCLLHIKGFFILQRQTTTPRILQLTAMKVTKDDDFNEKIKEMTNS